MKILIAAARFPFSLGKADSFTVYFLTKYLTDRGHKVVLVCFDSPDEGKQSDRDRLHEMCEEVVILPLSQNKAKARVALNVLGKIPYQAAYYRDAAMQRTIDDLIERHQPDILYAHLIRMSEYLRKHRGHLRIVAMQIAQTLNIKRLVKHDHNRLRRAFYKRELSRVVKYEQQVLQDFERVLIISPHDKQAIDPEQRHQNVFFNPHGIDVSYYSEDLHLEREDNVIIMTADYEAPTNVDAALYFYHDIFPLVLERFPDAQLWLVGRKPQKDIRDLGEKDNVLVTGRVEDIRPYLQRATVSIDPLRVGAGLQNKILVSMASSLPVVATSIANEGIGGNVDDVIFIGDTPRAFADHVIRLLGDAREREVVGDRALRFMQQYWTWEFHFERLEEMMHDMIEQGTDRPVENYYPISYDTL